MPENTRVARRQNLTRTLKRRTWRENLVVVAVIVHVTTLLGYISVGSWIVIENAVNHLSSKEQLCEDSYHMRKYVLLSVAFNTGSLVSYFVFARWKCDENARARATAFTIVHLAFCVWGLLTWRKFNSPCTDLINDTLVFYHHGTSVLNGLYFILYAVHETQLRRMSADYTVMVAFHCSSSTLDLSQLGVKYQPVPSETVFPKGLPDQSGILSSSGGFESSHIDATTHASPGTIADSSLPSPLKQTAERNMMGSQSQTQDAVWWRNSSAQADRTQAGANSQGAQGTGGSGAARRAALMTP